MRFTRLFTVLAVLSFCLVPVIAQERASKYLHLYEFHIDLANVPAFENYIKKVVAAAKKTGSSQRWMSFQGGSGTEVKPEMASTYRSLLERAAKVAEGVDNGPMTIRRSATTGTSFRFLAGTPFNKFAELDQMDGFWASMPTPSQLVAAESIQGLTGGQSGD